MCLVLGLAFPQHFLVICFGTDRDKKPCLLLVVTVAAGVSRRSRPAAAGKREASTRKPSSDGAPDQDDHAKAAMHSKAFRVEERGGGVGGLGRKHLSSHSQRQAVHGRLRMCRTTRKSSYMYQVGCYLLLESPKRWPICTPTRILIGTSIKTPSNRCNLNPKPTCRPPQPSAKLQSEALAGHSDKASPSRIWSSGFRV